MYQLKQKHWLGTCVPDLQSLKILMCLLHSASSHSRRVSPFHQFSELLPCVANMGGRPFQHLSYSSNLVPVSGRNSEFPRGLWRHWLRMHGLIQRQKTCCQIWNDTHVNGICKTASVAIHQAFLGKLITGAWLSFFPPLDVSLINTRILLGLQ